MAYILFARIGEMTLKPCMKPLLIANIYKDNFITFGGLVPSSVLLPYLDKISSRKNKNIISLRRFFTGKGKEPQIQNLFSNWLNHQFGEEIQFKSYEKNRDIVIVKPNAVIIEFKHNHSDSPKLLDDLRGSPPSLTAVQQLHKYLLTVC